MSQADRHLSRVKPSAFRRSIRQPPACRSALVRLPAEQGLLLVCSRCVDTPKNGATSHPGLQLLHVITRSCLCLITRHFQVSTETAIRVLALEAVSLLTDVGLALQFPALTSHCPGVPKASGTCNLTEKVTQRVLLKAE